MLHTQEVAGSSPAPPTLASVLSEELALKELLEALLGTEGRRKLVDLEPKNIHADFLIVHGKGGKERVIPLGVVIGRRLHNFIKGMKPNEKVFKLKATSVDNKIRLFAEKAEVDNFHTHIHGTNLPPICSSVLRI